MFKKYLYFANFIFFLHCIFGLFCLVGWAFTPLKALHIGSILIWIACWLILGYYPLTRLEFSIRNYYDSSIDPYREIISYYLQKYFHIKVKKEKILIFGIIIALFLLAMHIYY